MQKRAYRPDIDGLRAIAVLAVVLYHLGFETFSGGFVGVDVFLVISGYLITGIIKENIEKGNFTYAEFFMRRVRRLFPALFSTVALSFIAAYYLLPPPEMEKFGASVFSSIFSFSNIYFWAGSGYFDTQALTKPLLHTWSLSVEEQFYFIWPFFLVLLFRLPRSISGPVLLLVGLISLFAAQAMVTSHAQTAFFWMPFRVYEFCIGGMLAWYGSSGRTKHPIVSESLLALGYILIFYPILRFDDTTVFPGFSALLPCAGAILVIYAGEAKYLGALIRNKPTVMLGVISYSIYLVHWPLIVFYNYYVAGGAYNPTAQTILLVSTVVLAYLVFKFVEQPFRKKAGWGYSKQFIYALSVVCLAFPAASAWSSNGWAWRLPDELRQSIADMKSQRAAYWSEARNERKEFSGDGKRKKVAVLGNSFAVDVYYALLHRPDLDVVLSDNTSFMCYALNVSRKKYEGDFNCRRNFANILKQPYIHMADYIVINERWRLQNDIKRYLESLHTTVSSISRVNPHATIIIVGPRMTFSGWPRFVYQKILRYGRLVGVEAYVSKDYAFSLQELKRFDVALQEFSQERAIKYISLYDLFCADGYCEVLTDKKENIYWDEGHWTKAGAQYFHEKLERAKVYKEAFGT